MIRFYLQTSLVYIADSIVVDSDHYVSWWDTDTYDDRPTDLVSLYDSDSWWNIIAVEIDRSTWERLMIEDNERWGDYPTTAASTFRSTHESMRDGVGKYTSLITRNKYGFIARRDELAEHLRAEGSRMVVW